MHNNITQINNQPTVRWVAFTTRNDGKLLLHRLAYHIRKTVQHAVTGARADDKVIGQVRRFMNIQKDDVFPFFVLQRLNYRSSYF